MIVSASCGLWPRAATKSQRSCRVAEAERTDAISTGGCFALEGRCYTEGSTGSNQMVTEEEPRRGKLWGPYSSVE